MACQGLPLPVTVQGQNQPQKLENILVDVFLAETVGIVVKGNKIKLAVFPLCTYCGISM